MQTNGVKQSIERVRIEDSKRVSSEEIKRNYTQITGREALERLLAGEEIYAADSAESWKLIDGVLSYRDCDIDNEFARASLSLNAILDPEDDDWYVAPPFEARKEMLARPGEWVAKYETTAGWAYIGFDHAEMVVVGALDIGKNVYFTDAEVCPQSFEIDAAIPLDMQDIGKIAWGEAKEGVEA
ncbi:hypothetical protein BLD48_05850 [Exiguobacterium sp. KRL4]|uniref:hypothetical protein n=1 Tax=Exiguobacterium sp. KRL4 TaxID=1914536 RepID=UPI0008F850BB|nr:hypothetical protein [Exiguobacterium sp. KRL4]OIN67410.1 hypothetical protein BLD48_05850 [Exiguobacterium sp. KRL4]